MKPRLLIPLSLGFLAFFLFYSPSLAMEKPPLYLKLGEQRILNFGRLDRYSVSGNAIHYTRLPDQNELLVKGTTMGMSTIVINHDQKTDTQTIRVETKTENTYPHPLFQALNLLESTEAIDGGTQFILRGEIRTMKEAHAVAHLKKHFQNWIVDETTIEPGWLHQSTLQIYELLKNYPRLKLSSKEGSLSIQGAISSDFLAEALTKKIEAIQPLAHIEYQTTKGFSPTLYFKVFLLEVKKEFKSSLGIDLGSPTSLVDGTLSFPPFQAIANSSINYSIQALENLGKIRVLSSPELVVKSPGQAELFAGGEFPVHIKDHYEDKIIWKNFGLSLKLDVKEYNGEKVRLTIETELSHLDEAIKIDQTPGIKTNRIKTQVEGTMGKPLLLSGLLQEETRSGIRGLPGLAEIPVLGKLFGSDDFQNNRTELVAVLLPYSEPPQEPMQRISSDIPKGYLPVSRNYLSQDRVEELKNSREYPWNAL